MLQIYTLGLDTDSARLLLAPTAAAFGATLSDALEKNGDISASGGDLVGFAREINAAFAGKLFAAESLGGGIIELLAQNNLKISTAESCTGGLLAYALTSQSGASAVFDGGVVSYANAIKTAWLGVDGEVLASFGAVSEPVVAQMLDGALKLSGADFALATSGVAGPTGGSAAKPVGTVFVGAKMRDGAQIIERVHFSGDRAGVQQQAVTHALKMLLRVFYGG